MSDFLAKVLVVDDDPAILFLHKLIIKTGDLHPAPKTFSEPEAALSFILENDSQDSRMLVFLDINMPRMNGWDLLDQVVNKLQHADLKVIMVTSSLDREDRLKAQKYPPVMDFVEKPLDDSSVISLKEMLDAWIRGISN